MPIRLKRLLAEFAWYIIYIFREYLNKFVAVYFDNIIIFLKDPSKYIEHVKKVMRKLYNTGLSLNINKYKFNITKVKYLGLVFTLEGLKIPTKKVSTILDWPEPINIKKI
jgi:ribosome-interacting GTPase 1